MNILFVDDEPNVLNALQNALHRQRRRWNMSFVTSGADALAQMEKTPFDVIVSDMKMPNMKGSELLQEVRTRHPETMRILLSGQADREEILRSAHVTQQFLSKPCETTELQNVLERASCIQRMNSDPVVRHFVGQLDSIPTVPAVYQELVCAMSNPDRKFDDIASIVSKDIALTARVLQIVNSAFLGLSFKTSSIQEATSFLGLEMLRNLALTAHVYHEGAKSGSAMEKCSRVADHSMLVARLAKAFFPDRARGEEAFTCGLLHDLGDLILINNQKAARQLCTQMNCEKTEFTNPDAAEENMTILAPLHDMVGALLLGSWGLPLKTVEAVAGHHMPSRWARSSNELLAAVHVANAFVESFTDDDTELDTRIDKGYMEKGGFMTNFEVWRRKAEQIFADSAKPAAVNIGHKIGVHILQ